jgi:hypothetical protein
VAAEAGFAERSHKIAQGLEAKKIEALIGDFEFRLLSFTGLAGDRGARRIVRAVD